VVANGPSGGLKGHSYAQCPDRFSKAKGQSKSKGYVSKGAYEKGKGFSKSVQFHALSCLAFPGAFLAEAAQGSRVILDTCSRRGIVAAPGRDQCSLGIDPVFFLNMVGILQASSGVDIHNDSLGFCFFLCSG